MNWFYFAFSSVAFFTLLGLVQRRVALDTENPRAMSIVFNFYGAIIAIIIFVVTGGYKNFALPTGSLPWIFMVIGMFMYAMFERGRFLVAKLLDVSILITVENLSLVVAFVGSVFLYSEALTTNKAIGAFLIITSLVLIGFSKTKIKNFSLRGLGIAILISVFLGLGWLLDKKGALYFNPTTYTLLGWTVPLIFIYLPYFNIKDAIKEAKSSGWKVILMAALNVIGYYLQLKALEIGDATRVIPIVQSYAIFTVLLGIFLLKEKDNLWKKLIAATLAFMGGYLLVATH